MDTYTKFSYIYNFIMQYFVYLSEKETIDVYESSDSESEDIDFDYLSE